MGTRIDVSSRCNVFSAKSHPSNFSLRRFRVPRGSADKILASLTFHAMLQHLSIQNYATAESLEVDFRAGMSALTGETGAGKSIIVGALGLALGDRADKTVVRTGTKQTGIAAEFDVSNNDAAVAWLEENQLRGDTGGSCLIRRVVGGDGRSRAFVNDAPVTMAGLRRLGALLVDIVSQREHQSLLRRQTQLSLLDDYCVERALLDELRSLHGGWQANQRDIARLRGEDDEGRVQLWSYQLGELRELAAEDGETESLEREHRRLSGAEQALTALAEAARDIADNEQFNALDSLRRALQLLGTLKGDSDSGRIANAMESLEAARIQIDEAAADLRAAADEFPIDPERLSQVDERLGKLHDMARKHKVKPAELARLTRSLQERLRANHHREEELLRLGEEDSKLREQYAAVAKRVGDRRREGANRLSREIETRIALLGMGDAAMEIRFEPMPPDTINASGLEKVRIPCRHQPRAGAGFDIENRLGRRTVPHQPGDQGRDRANLPNALPGFRRSRCRHRRRRRRPGRRVVADSGRVGTDSLRHPSAPGRQPRASAIFGEQEQRRRERADFDRRTRRECESARTGAHARRSENRRRSLGPRPADARGRSGIPLTARADAVKIHAVVGDLEAKFFGDLDLPIFDDVVVELLDLAACRANNVVVMVARH